MKKNNENVIPTKSRGKNTFGNCMIIGEFKYLQARILHNKYKEAMNF